MTNALHGFFQSIATAPTIESLRFRFMDEIHTHFNTDKWGIYLLDKQHEIAHCDTVGVSDHFIERYQKIGKQVDPVMQYVMDYHAHAHEEIVLPAGTWKQSPLYDRCCSEYDHAHIMTGPIVGQGELIGSIHFARGDNTPAFNQQDLSKLSAVCQHVSAKLASLQQQTSSNPHIGKLTARERQIANLVAQGKTNAEIGTELWITQNSVKQALKRMFRKLEVASRTEMVAKLGLTL
ncbi:GAF domain-containing protein [filamentous cyanobacterium LEGE 11480]|uniref:GAF domain-containing protein n=1 Tax=Romeriopsis navalis LEGE 11480 TaxID=2777977 RepID=A0A928VJ37_9CYAN|nr:LuxR C-terminal-related transcriptional regulator [Romeriopsis navalis]MBE9028688.1 GAF domain-containing protein [Romeriopsis navalis LEGE 11480]